MPTRREVIISGAAAVATAMLPTLGPNQSVPHRKMPASFRQDRPLHELQQAFVDLRFGMFIHFNMATFQDREWGDPRGNVADFNPTRLDTDQWAQAALSAKMRFGCLTTKHHDGFAIWPTRTQADSIAMNPGCPDVVRAYTDSFRRAGLRVGLYYSILDLRQDIRRFNVTPAKIQLIKDQLAELLTNYGTIDFIIFDGWDAPWSRIPYDEVPFTEIYAHIKQLQPNCLISELNASEYPPTGLYYTDIKAFEQNAGQSIPSDSTIPAQSCVTLTDGWFWKQSDEHAELKSVDQVVNEWLIPQNQIHCNLICNAAPNREGRFSDNIVRRLAEIGAAWNPEGAVPRIPAAIPVTTPNLATGCTVHASSYPDTVGPDLAVDGHFGSTWYPENEDAAPWVEITFPAVAEINLLTLVEPVGKFDDYQSSRIRRYGFQIWRDGKWIEVVSGDQPRRVEFHPIELVRTSRLRFWFEGFPGVNAAHIAELGAYREPERRTRK